MIAMAISRETIPLRLPGRDVPVTPNPHLDIAQFLRVEEKKSVVVGVALRGARLESVPFGANPDDVVELQFEGGLSQWVRVDQLRDDLRKRNDLLTRGGPAENETIIPPDLGAPPSRGGVDLLLKGLKILGINPVGDVADLAVRKVVSKFEDSLQPGPGLYVLSDPRTVEKQIRDSKDLDSSAPYLLFLHGTASSIAGSFGGLAPGPDNEEERIPPDDWDALKKKYPGRILGLQHKTLSVSPVQNALDAAALLPEGAQLHLVSHSRGGLIGELLCLNDLPKTYLDAFGKVPDDIDPNIRPEMEEIRKEEIDRITRLATELARKHFNVQRFVRVASPARGTVLASKRLDLYLSVMLNVLGLIPALKASMLYTLLKAVTIETAHRRTDPRQLPGIEAMMPESPLINLLNQPDLTSSADLAVIAGDLAPDSLWQRLQTLAVELFYLQPNDLVVNTSAMYGGMERRTIASYFFNKGPHVNHFHYFRNTGTRALLRGWLQAEQGAKVEGFRPFLPNQTVFVADTRRAGDAQEPRPVVFFVPDFMGTRMEDATGVIWPALSGLGKSGLDRLASGDEKVKPGDLVAELYARLINRLQKKYRVEAIGYDWRKGFDQAALALRGKIEASLADASLAKLPFHFVAHGAGGLAVLKLAVDPFWDRVAEHNGRIVLLGTPVRGCAAMARLLIPDSPINRLLRMADHLSTIKPEALFAQCQSVQELLPGPAQYQLDLPKLAKIKNLMCVLGKEDCTITGVEKDGTPSYTSAGDGLVTWASSRLDGVPAWQVNASHGMLGRHDPLAESLIDLLEQGAAPNLPRAANAPPVIDTTPPPPSVPLFFPTEDDLLDAAMAGKPPSQFDLLDRPLSVSVSHGHLRHAKFPVMVGHYEEDMIVSAEKVLDSLLDRRLTQRFQMGVYPGEPGTVEIVLNSGGSPPGALVIGLGEVGALNVEKLRRGVQAALLRYALMLSEQAEEQRSGPRVANFSAVLMGTYGQGSVRDSVAAVVQGALDANCRLKEQKLEDRVRVEELEIVELYQDIAAQAARELLTLEDRLNGDAVNGNVIKAAPRLKVLSGGHSSRPLNPYIAGWWRRIKIGQRAPKPGETQPPDGLEYTVLTDRARAEDFVTVTQDQVLAPLLKQATSQTLWDKQLSTVLFQLLIPRALRNETQDRVNLVLVVDEEAANYPWELLAQRTRGGVEPMAVQCGMLRQLRTSTQEQRLPTVGGNDVLIVGDTQSGWSDLPGAQAEAQAVEARLSKSYRTKLLLKEDALTIVNALLPQDYRIVHLAGHGNFDPDNLAKSGMKIGPDQWLSSEILDAMSSAPDLVFVNCCHLGTVQGAKEGTPSPQLAASFAVKLMNLGVKAVIAAGWAVDDRAARTFAERFYQRMIEGVRFGDAVLEARQHTFTLYPQGNTWGAYQCYGNPDFRLDGAQGQSAGAPGQRHFVAREEVLQQVEDIAAQAADGMNDQLLEQLSQLRNDIPGEWRDGEMLAAFGSAFRDLGKFEDAIDAYRQALADENGKAPIQAAQQIANLLDRTSKKATEEQQKMLRTEALEWLNKVAPLADTAELAALRGAYYKRDGKDSRERALAEYQKSFDIHKRVFSDDLYYPGLNAAALAFLLNKNSDEWLQTIKECSDAAIRQRELVRDIWSRAGVVDAMLLGSLWSGGLADQKNPIAANYIAVITSGGSHREIDSILSQIEFLAKELPEGHAARAPLQEILSDVTAQFT